VRARVYVPALFLLRESGRGSAYTFPRRTRRHISAPWVREDAAQAVEAHLETQGGRKCSCVRTRRAIGLDACAHRRVAPLTLFIYLFFPLWRELLPFKNDLVVFACQINRRRAGLWRLWRLCFVPIVLLQAAVEAAATGRCGGCSSNILLPRRPVARRTDAGREGRRVLSRFPGVGPVKLAQDLKAVRTAARQGGRYSLPLLRGCCTGPQHQQGRRCRPPAARLRAASLLLAAAAVGSSPRVERPPKRQLCCLRWP